MALTTAGERCHRAKSVFSGGEHATAAAPNAKSPARCPPGLLADYAFCHASRFVIKRNFLIVCTGGIACHEA
jgi:hypothetical protein